MREPNFLAAGVIAVGNVLAFGFFWTIGGWFLPWALLFFHAPSTAGLLWVLGW